MLGRNIRESRPHVEAARLGQLTQGTVFNCAAAFRYPDKQVYGLTITARCDVAQEKYRLLNYVPVVHLGDWLLVDGLEILLETERKEQTGKFKNELGQIGISPNLLLSVSLSEIIEIHFPATTSDRKTVKARERVEKYRSEIDEIATISANPRRSLSWLLENRPKSVKSIIKDLFEHKVLGYYFMERLSPSSGIEGFVCLLREVTSLPREISQELAKGLSDTRWQELTKHLKVNNLDFSIDDFAAPVSQIGSPSIEHLMQSYANLFGRIGIANPRLEEMDEIIERLHSNKGD